jgi:leader peptidase (prepilin peptidase)/N-methyltransferase
MELVLAASVLAPGLALGSFLNVVAARVPLKRSLVRPRSACGSCGAAIAWYDNIPLLSYVLLRGRCRSCGTGFSLRYPAVELLTALLVAASFLAFGLSGKAVVAAFFCSVLVVLSAIDLEHRILPDRIVLPSAAVVLAANTALDPSLQWVLAAFGASLFLFLAVLAHPAGMGMGDVKLALLLGAALGKTVPVALMLGMMVALLPAAVLLARHGSAARKMAIPFGPFLAFGSVVALFAGDFLLGLYLETLGWN